MTTPNQTAVDPQVLEHVTKAIYQARWVDAYGKNAALATDSELAAVAILAVYQSLYARFSNA